jgi:4-diphosphocytidyl-2-C-methyl-D-erythritol kinase
MTFVKIKSHAKLNLALNVTGKKSSLHSIESVITFVDLHDEIFIKKSKSSKHKILFTGRFSKKINKNNTISRLLEILENKKILKNKKFHIKIIKKIPNKAGLGGGSMNAATILKYFIKKKVISIKKKEITKITKLIGSDVILGLNPKSSILTSKNVIKVFNHKNKFYTLIVKPNFGCSTKYIYSKVKKFDKPKFNRPYKSMFNINNLKKMNNSLQSIAFSKYPKLKKIKSELEKSSKLEFVRMTGSGSALVAYFQTKENCERAKKRFNKQHKNYWCITSKTI